jgi:signal transduction histidine kinase
MKYIFKTLIFVFIIADIALYSNVSYEDIMLLLIIAAVNLFKERLYDSIYMTLVYFIITIVAVHDKYTLGILFGVTVFDVVYKKMYIGVIPVLTAVAYLLWDKPYVIMTLLILSLCGLLAYICRNSEDKESRYINSLDDERRLRYELEQTKMKLLNSAKDVAYLAEVKERNRIAREIHDNVGHSIAGILIQLQASYKLLDKDGQKSRDILKKSIDCLADAVTLLRDTVHNIKPKEILGVDYVKCLIQEFSFCPVDFQFSGDFNSLSPGHLEILSTNIKEALTNTVKHSRATNVVIKMDINERYARLYIKDNGIGCSKIKEGLGISGMKERIENMGGSISISSDNGFMIVCLIPIDKQLYA